MKFFYIMILFLVLSSSAAEFKSGESVKVVNGDTMLTDLFAGAGSVDIRGYIKGDLYTGCETVNIEGVIEDDVIAGCRRLILTGKVNDMVISGGESVVIDGEVGGDVLVYSGSLKITDRGLIRGNVITGSGEFRLEGGRINGSVRGSSRNSFLNGFIGEGVDLEAHNIDFGPDYSSPMGTKLTVTRKMDIDKIPFRPGDLEIIIKPESSFYQTKFFYWGILAMFVVGIILSLFFKPFLKNLTSSMTERVGYGSGIGFLFLVLTPLTITILLVLIITIPAALILAAVYLITVYIGIIITGLFIGNYLQKLLIKGEEPGNLILSMLIGIVLIALFREIPRIGWLIDVGAVCLGAGSLLLYLWDLTQTGVRKA
ncbi:MAG: polymer-forming cytoskeletal protein [Calditrichaceae bacterium]